MAVIQYTQGAVLGAYQQWLMEVGAQACRDRLPGPVVNPIQPRPGCGPWAQEGTSVRYTVSTSLAAATVFFSGQMQTAQGQWQNTGETVRATSAGGVTRIIRPVTAGSYANMVASVGSASVSEGEVYTTVELGRQNNGEFTPYAVLISGYPGSTTPIDACSGSHQQNRPPGTGGGGGCCIGELHDDTFDPDTENYVVTVPSGSRGRLVFVNATYRALGGAANRTVNVQINPISGFAYSDTNQNVQVSGEIKGYVWQLGSQTYVDVSTDDRYRPLPENLWFDQDFSVEIRANNVQSGDDWLTSDITYEIQAP